MIEVIKKDSLPVAPATPGIRRYLAFKGDGYVIIRSEADPGVISAWHHHGDHEVYGFILSGAEQFNYGPNGKDAIDAEQGDFFHIPPNTVHRDVNPSPDRLQEAVLFFYGTGPLVVNLDGPDPA